MRKRLPAEFERLREELTSSQIGFLLTELEMGATFAKMAVESSKEKRARTTRFARVVYDRVVRYISRVVLSESEKEDLGEQIASLKSILQSLGETF